MPATRAKVKPYTPDQLAPLGLESAKLPRHIAIIMDGNGRWARQKGWKRIRGHEEGVRAVREMSEECARLGLRQLTLYAFSSENWKRPRPEVDLLMALLEKYMIQERDRIMANNIRLITIGETEKLPTSARTEIDKTIALSRENTGLTLCLALNYGGRQEIVDAVRKLAVDLLARQVLPESVDEKVFARYLYQPDMVDPDLVIRTAGEMRVSNFLLWQISYSEIWTTPVLWPDFQIADLHQALKDYAGRVRRFGGLV